MNCPICNATEPASVYQYRALPPAPREAWYDGFSEYICRCGARIGRWSGRVLDERECERRYGGEPVRVTKERKEG